ncbi:MULTISPECIES: ROK family transcriptional regulator [unclassified Oceanispirochaeta]|uniref:ROK family transcriptional regulator n=1 Tax=unclassified Oceanispirochaeta TaxID=2635722 RepID=UPI000E092C15|nr:MULTISPECIES: ROK family transcriptional regulator [unclassified Oceanispirochaeta]MBF9018191.1 ROK family transcriptional regulator [Oceanispirochaeta sp. M2]NPD74626.1 ROK family transcriptional regulator [Oceanispirochaeta sp. M1]RDG29497.1 ROK family transcriptional regulator [Oceanispirochaeta sp. M1]
MKGNNSRINKIRNRAVILKMIQQNDQITRAEIAKKTGLTRAAITSIVSTMMNDGLVTEVTDQTDNKKTIPLTINNVKFRTISLYLGRFSVIGGLFDISGNLLYSEELFHGESGLNKYEILDHLLLLVKNITKTCQLNIESILGIGIAGPGPISQQNIGISETGETSELPPYRWGEYNIKSVMEQNLNLPVYLENNCNISALGERWYGAGRGFDNFVIYTVGIGIGAGVVLNGEMQSGQKDVFSEVGHITVDLNGPECSCGNKGCLEIYGGFRSLVDSYYKEMGYGLNEITDNQYVRNIESIFKKADEGDLICQELIRKQAEILSIGAVTLANMYSPERIIITSNEIGDTDYSRMIPVIQNLVSKRAFKVIAKNVVVIKSPLGKDVDLYGGAALVLENYLEKESPGI